jgi:signal peptidase I
MTSDYTKKHKTTGGNAAKVREQIFQELWVEQYFKKQEGWLNVLSGSMSPMIPVTARIFLKPVPLSQIRLGAVIVFRQKTKIISHWVIGIKRKGQKLRFVQQGNNRSSPSTIDGKNILGKVFVVEHDEISFRLDAVWKKLYGFRKVLIMRTKYELHRFLNVLYASKKERTCKKSDPTHQS